MLLSICIPTYDRPKQVERLLRELPPQLVPGVEVIIRDDSSNNETERLIESHRADPRIRYFRGERMGVDRAILFLVKEAKGEYVWLFGDDEMVDGAAGYIISVLKRFPKISFMYLNARSSNSEQAAFDFGEDRFFLDRNEVIEKIGHLLTFISALVFKRSEALTGVRQSEKYADSALLDFYLVLHILSGTGRFYFINKPLIITDPKMPDEPLWYDSYRVFIVNVSNILHEFDGKFRKESIRRLLKEHFGRILKAILVYRVKSYTHDWGSESIKTGNLLRFMWSFPEFWMSLPFLMMPRAVLRPVYRAYKSFKR